MKLFQFPDQPEAAARRWNQQRDQVPEGCDQQGRYPFATEASTDLLADADRELVRWVWLTYAGLLLIGLGFLAWWLWTGR